MRRAPLLRIAHQPRGFLIELALQVFRVGRNPHRRVVLPRPEPGGRKIAQRFAKARSGFRQQNIVLAFLLPRLKGIGGGARIIFLLRPRLGKFPQHLVQKLRGFLRRHPFMPSRWPHPVIFPFLDPVPHIEARGEGADIKLGIGLEQGGHHRLRPRPIAPRQIGGNFRRFARRRIMAVAQAQQKFIGHKLQGLKLVGQGIKRQRAGKTGGRWRGHARRADEGEKLRHIQMLLLPGCPRRRLGSACRKGQPVNQECGVANQMRSLPQQGEPIGGRQSPRGRRQFNAHKHGPVRAVDHAILIMGIIIHPYSLSRLRREKEPRHGPEIYQPF